jgi:small GTP-binding protein domain
MYNPSLGGTGVGDSGGRYILASSARQGALSLISVFADEAMLAERIDARLCYKNGASAVVAPLRKGALRYGWLHSPSGETLDEIMLAKPEDNSRSIMLHGGKTVRNAVVGFLEASGFSPMAEADAVRCDPLFDPVLAGTITTMQAGAVLAVREKQRRGESVVMPEAILRTHRILVAGPPNAGKSSLLNHLAGYARAFVHEEAGATLDVVDELVDCGGLAVLLGDMPGFRCEQDALEKAAWDKAVERLRRAEAIFFVCDGSRPWDKATDEAARAVRDNASAPVLVVVNKSDLPSRLDGEPWRSHFPGAAHVRVGSLPEGNALAVLGEAVWTLLGVTRF